MYAAHFAAALAIKSRQPSAPTWALLTGAFVPDFVWIALARAGLEPTQSDTFFDDWSHSLAMVLVWATLFTLPFWRRGRAVVAALWLSVFSHFVLDLPIHPKDLALYPHSSVHLGWGLWRIGPKPYWWIQLAVLVVLTAVYVHGSRKMPLPRNLVAATCVVLVALHLVWRL